MHRFVHHHWILQVNKKFAQQVIRSAAGMWIRLAQSSPNARGRLVSRLPETNETELIGPQQRQQLWIVELADFDPRQRGVVVGRLALATERH